jgi:dipeptidyl aminopeptidase/acylaminoacyl peptidase
MFGRLLRCVAAASLLFAPLLAPSLVAQGAARPFTTEDALDVRTVRIADVTPDARWIAATVSTRRDRSNVDHFRFGDPTYIAPSLGELLVVDATTGTTRPVFSTPEQLRGATWSPDGKRLAFFRLQAGSYRLYTYDAATGRSTPVALKTAKAISSNSSLVWSPDGRSVLLALRPDKWADSARAAFVALSEGPIVVQTSRDAFLDWDRVRGLANEEIPALVTVASGAVAELPVQASLGDPHFAQDGTYLVYTVADARRTAYERAKGTWYGLFRLALGGNATAVVDTLIAPREQRITGRWNEQATHFAFSEKGNVFVRAISGDSAVNLTATFRTPVSATDTSKLSFAVDRWRPDGAALLLTSKQGYHLLDVAAGTMRTVLTFQGEEDTRPRLATEGWSADGRSVYMSTSARDRWARGLVRLDVGTGRTETLVSNTNLYADWHVSEDGTRVVYRMSDGDQPDELYASDIAFAQAKPLTTLNPQLAGVALAKSELVDYLDADGNRLYGVLYYPFGYEAGKKYPLVAEVYESFFDNGYNENMNLVTARGNFGFRPSVDLEVGYPGEAWIKGVPAAVNTLIARGLVDEKQLGVYGQSYGGYAVNLLVTQTDRFAAAVNVSGKVNIISFLGDSEKITTRNYNAAEEGQDRIGATLWEQPQKYIATSAVMFADRIRTPLLLMSGEGDWNVPATNQREMYYALRRLGKEVEWVNYMRGGHGAGRASTVEDFHDHWQRLLDWMQVHFAKRTGDAKVTP